MAAVADAAGGVAGAAAAPVTPREIDSLLARSEIFGKDVGGDGAGPAMLLDQRRARELKARLVEEAGRELLSVAAAPAEEIDRMYRVVERYKGYAGARHCSRAIIYGESV
jgi:hypothetical protein